VMREVTERPEAVAAGNALLVGARRERILDEASTLLTDPQTYARMSRPSDVFGDGHAAERIVAALEEAGR
jgi:UDP-N-acetylglucosamine 2-epimerase (non-hydrolysing)